MHLRILSIMVIFTTCTAAGMYVWLYVKAIAESVLSSLLVEPRQPADAPPSGDVRQLFPWTNRSHASHPLQVS
jgi:hypothetical protein